MNSRPPISEPFLLGGKPIDNPAWIRWFNKSVLSMDATEITGLGTLAVLDSVTLALVSDAGDLAALDSVSWLTQVDDKPSALYQIFYQASAPTTGMSSGDFWMDTDDNQLYRYNGASWVSVQDAGISAALSAAGDAQATADGKIITFLQDSIPTSTAIGDLWIDTDDDNKMYRAASAGANEIAAGEWVLVRDAGIASALETAAQAIADAAGAQGTADGKVVTFFQSGIPTSTAIGDLWIDTDDDNKLYRAESIGSNEIKSGEWVLVRDAGIAAAISAAGDAQSTADGKIATFIQAAIPTSTSIGDLWIDSDDGNKVYRAASLGADEIKAGEWVEVSWDYSNLANLPTLGDLASLDDITMSYVTDAGALAVLSDLGTENFARNSDFAVWDAGTSAEPSGWTLSGTSASVARNATAAYVDFGAYSVAVTNGAGNSASLYQDISAVHTIRYFKGRSIIAGANIYSATASRARVRIYTDGASPASAYSAYHSGKSEFQWLSCASIIVPSDATYIRLSLEISAGDAITVYMDGAVSIEGSYITDKFIQNGLMRPGGSGCIVNAGYIGYFANGVPTTYIKSDGTFRFYRNSTNYFLYDGSNMEFSSSGAGKFIIANGGDIQLRGSDGSNPGSLDLHVASDASGYYGSLYGVTTGNWIYFLPLGSGAAGNLSLLIGNGPNYWKLLGLFATDITLDATNDIELNTPLVRPESNGGTDIGNNSCWFGNVECVTLDDSHDISYLDDKDDLADMMKVGPKIDKHGNPIIDPKTGNQIIDDSTLPEYVCTKADGKVHMRDHRTHGPNAAFHGWLLGGIKQLKRELDLLRAEVNVLKME